MNGYKNVVYLYNGILSNPKGTKFNIDITTWVNSESIMGRDMYQTQKDIYCMTPLL